MKNAYPKNFFNLKIGPLKPFRFKVLKKFVGNSRVKVLDVGCGNESYSLAKRFLNISDYVGLDKNDYDGENEYEKIPNIIYIDVDKDYKKIKNIDADFDLIILSHLIEHTINFEKYMKIFITKLNPGGFIYIETPHPRTLKYPSAEGFLNFYDDPTHLRCFELNEIQNYLVGNEMLILSSGTRRDLFRIIFLSPLVVLANILYFIPIKRKFLSSGLWDILGVASFVVSQKKK